MTHLDQRPTKILICVNRRFKADEPSCAARGSFAIAEAIERGVRERRIDIVAERLICFGQCNKGPTVKLVPVDIIGSCGAGVLNFTLFPAGGCQFKPSFISRWVPLKNLKDRPVGSKRNRRYA